ncbi:MAG TPA: hypothetical protein VMS17_27000 [Gemmataceae bacterium]|nr:hypothetical protein [Gemmataceae bacterium]
MARERRDAGFQAETLLTNKRANVGDATAFGVVDATLRVLHHPRIAVGPVDVKAFAEYRLVDAVRL